MRRIVNRRAEKLADGRVKVVATVGEREWSCACRPSEGHDHDAVLVEFANSLDRVDEVRTQVANLVGLTGNRRGVEYVVNGVELQVLGPGLVRSIVTLAIGQHSETITRDFTDPRHLRASYVISDALRGIADHTDSHADAEAHAARFA